MKNFIEKILRAKLSPREQAHFAKRLSFLLGAGVPLLEGISIIAEQYAGGRISWIFEKIKTDVSKGFYLSKSLAGLPAVFENFSINVIRVGEESGLLKDNLSYLADELLKKHDLRQKIFAALLYPACVSLATLALTIFLVGFIFPKITPIFKGLRITLPATTRFLVATSDFMRHFWVWLLVGGLVLIVGAIVSVKKIPRARLFLDSLIPRLPFIGPLVRDYNAANLARSLGLLLKGGMHLSEAIYVSADSFDNAYYRARLLAIAPQIGSEGALGKFMSREKLFPDIWNHMVAIGERSGTLSDSLLYCATIFDGEVSNRTKNLSNALEPALMVAMGTIVGFIAISIITPIYAITEHLRN